MTAPEKTAAELAAEAKAKKDAEKATKAQAKEAEKKVAKEKREAEAKAKADAKAAEKKAADDKKAADKKAKEDAKAAAEKAKSEAKQPEQNGIRRPDPKTQTGKVWSLADTLSNSRGSPVAIADLLAAGRAEKINDATIRTQYARWRKFYSVAGRVLSTADVKAAEDAKVAAAAAAEAAKNKQAEGGAGASA